MTKSKYVTNNFCSHDKFEKLDIVCFWIFLPDSTRKGKSCILQYIEGIYDEMQFSSFPVQWGVKIWKQIAFYFSNLSFEQKLFVTYFDLVTLKVAYLVI